MKYYLIKGEVGYSITPYEPLMFEGKAYAANEYKIVDGNLVKLTCEERLDYDVEHSFMIPHILVDWDYEAIDKDVERMKAGDYKPLYLPGV